MDSEELKRLLANLTDAATRIETKMDALLDALIEDDEPEPDEQPGIYGRERGEDETL